MTAKEFTALEICAGAGGQAIGVSKAGFKHVGLVENDAHACRTLLLNRPRWNVIEEDVTEFSASSFRGVSLFGGGIPCPPFSKAGKQLAHQDERDLFPHAIRLISECKPRAVMLENVRGLLDPSCRSYFEGIVSQISKLGYQVDYRVLNASDFGVPQLRPRLIIVALKPTDFQRFAWPLRRIPPPSVGQALFSLISANGWLQAEEWKSRANVIAPTLVGGSKKHGGPDLGPTRAKKAWAAIGVDGHGLANHPPEVEFSGSPRLTVEMTAVLQGFPTDWKFSGFKTNQYRQIGNAFPPAVAAAVARCIRRALVGGGSKRPNSRRLAGV